MKKDCPCKHHHLKETIEKGKKIVEESTGNPLNPNNEKLAKKFWNPH